MPGVIVERQAFSSAYGRLSWRYHVAGDALASPPRRSERGIENHPLVRVLAKQSRSAERRNTLSYPIILPPNWVGLPGHPRNSARLICVVCVHGFGPRLRGFLCYNLLIYRYFLNPAEGDRSDVLAANEAQPLQALGSVQATRRGALHRTTLGAGAHARQASVYRAVLGPGPVTPVFRRSSAPRP